MTDPAPPDAPRRADASRNREAVVAAAFEVLSRQPEASLKDVASASGLGRTTLYRHFANREALITALLEDVISDSIAAVVTILAEVDDPHDVLPRVATETLAIGDRYRFLAAHEALLDEVRRRPREDPLQDWIQRGTARGVLRPLGTTWIQGMMFALVTAAHEEVLEGRESLEAAAEKLGATMIAAFAA